MFIAFQLKDATNFVANQRPIIVKHLDEAFSAQYDQAVNLARKASTGKMIDPNADANEVSSIHDCCLILCHD